MIIGRWENQSIGTIGASETACLLAYLELDLRDLSPPLVWAGPAFRGQGTDGETSLTIAGVGPLFPGAWLPKAHGKSPCRLELHFLLQHFPNHRALWLGQPSVCFMAGFVTCMLRHVLEDGFSFNLCVDR